MEPTTTKQDRLGARDPHDVRETLRRAAEPSGATVDRFPAQSALKEAHAVIRLSSRDWNWLLDLMANPPEPNAKLKAALKRYQDAWQDNDAGTAFNWKP